AIWRLIELNKSGYRLPDDDPELVPWHHRLDELAGDAAPEDLLLAEIEAMGPDGQPRDPRQLELFGTLLTELQGMKARSGPGDVHRVSTLGGATYAGTGKGRPLPRLFTVPGPLTGLSAAVLQFHGNRERAVPECDQRDGTCEQQALHFEPRALAKLHGENRDQHLDRHARCPEARVEPD